MLGERGGEGEVGGSVWEVGVVRLGRHMSGGTTGIVSASL